MPDCYEVRQALCNYQTNTIQQCTQQTQTTTQVCTQKVNQGYNKCTQTANQSYKQCSGWWRWFCIAWTWITHAVCVAWTWVDNFVCIAWTYITQWVCIAWAVIVTYTCIIVGWIVYWVCSTPQALLNLCLDMQQATFVMIQCCRPSDTPRNPIDKPGWQLVFEDDFTTGSVDASKWSDCPWWGVRYSSGSNPAEYYPPENSVPAPFAFGSSSVSLLANNQPVTITDPNFPSGHTFPYTAGWLEWRQPFDRQHGYFEIRCKVPGAPDMWPAFWLASRKKWPPEIDVFEFYTSDTSHFESTQHWGSDPNHPKQTRSHSVCKAADYFHIYACEWSGTDIRWYYDNHLIRIASDGISDFVYDMFVIIGNGVDNRSGHNPQNSIFPNAFEVDYVRAYAQ